MPVRLATDPATGLQGFRWGRRGRVITYGHGTGRTHGDALALTIEQGRRQRRRKMAHEAATHRAEPAVVIPGVRVDARRRIVQPRARFKGRAPIFSDRSTQEHERLLHSQVDLVQRVFFELAGPVLERLPAKADSRRIDADTFEILDVLRFLRSAMSGAAEAAVDGLRFIAEGIDDDATEEQDSMLSRLLAIPIATAAGAVDLVEAWITTNVDLITSLSSDVLDDVEDLVLQTMSEGIPTRDLAKEIEARFEVSRSRASLIARDQTAKLAGQIAQARQETYGVTEYQWSTSGDSRVRQKHAALDGKIFTWAEGAPGGIHPGQEFQCRCVASPVLPGEDKAELIAQAKARQEAELLILQFSPTVQGTIPNHSGFTDWNAQRIGQLREGIRSAVGL